MNFKIFIKTLPHQSYLTTVTTLPQLCTGTVCFKIQPTSMKMCHAWAMRMLFLTWATVYIWSSIYFFSMYLNRVFKTRLVSIGCYLLTSFRLTGASGFARVSTMISKSLRCQPIWKFCTILAMRILLSCSANRLPTHILGPWPKGSMTKGWTSSFNGWFLSQRSGRYSRGS